jgi:alpha-1,2-mannosyltransferase
MRPKERKRSGIPLIRAFAKPRFAWTVAASLTAALAAAYLWSHVVSVLFAPQPPVAEDFSMYYQGAWSLRTLGDPYAIPDPNLHAPWDPRITTTYIYPPLFAALLLPLTFLPPELVVRFWIVGVQLLAVLALIVVYRQLGRPSRGELLAMVAISATFLPLIATALTGAMNTLLLLLCALALPFILRHEQRRAGVLLGLAIGIKFLPAAALPYLLFRRFGRAVLYALATFALTLAVGAAITRPAGLAHYLFDLLPALGSGNGYRENQSLLGLFTRLCSPGGLDGASAGPGVCARGLTLGADVGLFAGLWLATARRSLWELSESARHRRRALEYGLALLTVPLVASISWGLHLVLVLLPIAILLRYLVAERALTRLRLVALIVALACFSLVRGAFYMTILHPFPGTPPLPLQIAMRVASESYVVGLLLLWLLAFHVLRRADAVAVKQSRPRARAA